MKSQFWTAPNQLTLLRLIFIPFVIMNVLDDNWHWALGLLVLAGLSDALDGWLARVATRRNPNITAVALANKNARTVWALLAHGRDYQVGYRSINPIAA